MNAKGKDCDNVLRQLRRVSILVDYRAPDLVIDLLHVFVWHVAHLTLRSASYGTFGSGMRTQADIEVKGRSGTPSNSI